MSRTLPRQPSKKNRKPGGTKAKKSFTLSPDSLAFLETMRRKRRAHSTSSVLEEILQAARHAEARASVERAVQGYYSSLSKSEAEEQELWGSFALREFPEVDAINAEIATPR